MMGSALRSDADNLYRRDIIQSTNSESLEEEDFYEGKEICNFTGCLAMIFFSRSTTVDMVMRVNFTLVHEIRKVFPNLSEFRTSVSCIQCPSRLWRGDPTALHRVETTPIRLVWPVRVWKFMVEGILLELQLTSLSILRSSFCYLV